MAARKKLRYEVSLEAVGVKELVATASDVTVAAAMAASYRAAIAADSSLFMPARVEVTILDTQTGEKL